MQMRVELYGEDLPQIVIDRLEKLKVLSVMDCGNLLEFHQRLVKNH